MKKPRVFNLALLLVGVLCVQTSRAQDDNPFSLPEGTRARLGKGAINGWWRSYNSDLFGGVCAPIASAGGGGGGKIWFWDVETATLRGRTFWGHSVVFAPDGKTIASADGETVPLWDAESETLKNMRGHRHFWRFHRMVKPSPQL